VACHGRSRAGRGGSSRAGSVQGVNTLLLIVLAGILLYFLARTQVADEPITWLIRRVQDAVHP